MKLNDDINPEKMAKVIKDVAEVIRKINPNLILEVNFAPVEPIEKFQSETEEEREARIKDFHESMITKNVDGEEEYYEVSGMPFGIPKKALIFPKHNFVSL